MPSFKSNVFFTVMKIVFVSNFLNDHQLPLCLELIDLIGKDNFQFVATTPISSNRISLGFEDMNETRDFVVKAYVSNEEYLKAENLANEADVVIIGSAPYSFVRERLRRNKLTFIYAERLFKQGKLSLFYPPKFVKIYNLYTKNRNKNCYLLCASAYSKDDASFCGFPADKCYKWGYFPDVEQYADFETVIKKKSCINNGTPQILWAGRFIDWKHPEVAVHVANELKKQGNSFKLIMVGDGPMRYKIQDIVSAQELQDCVKIVGSKSPRDVRILMEESDIFLFTSDKNEGWGAVLNESMNAGCIVIANYSIGSVPFLIDNAVNGYYYKKNDSSYIVDLIKLVIKDSNLQRLIAIEANRTISERWDAKTAAQNLLYLIDSINANARLSIVDGPCSKA